MTSTTTVSLEFRSGEREGERERVRERERWREERVEGEREGEGERGEIRENQSSIDTTNRIILINLLVSVSL